MKPLEGLAFGVIALGALGLVSYWLGVRAAELGHPGPCIWRRLAVLWVCAVAAVALGLWLQERYPEGLFDLGATRVAGQGGWVSGPGGDWLPLAAGLLGMAVCAAGALWASRSLQHPPAPPPEETP